MPACALKFLAFFQFLEAFVACQRPRFQVKDCSSLGTDCNHSRWETKRTGLSALNGWNYSSTIALILSFCAVVRSEVENVFSMCSGTDNCTCSSTPFHPILRLQSHPNLPRQGAVHREWSTTADQLFTSPLLIDKRLTTLLGKRFFQNSVVITPKGLEALCYQVVGDARMEKPFGSQLQANF